MIQYGKLSVEEVLEKVSPTGFIKWDKWTLLCQSLSFHTFKMKGTTCVVCGIKAAYFSIEHQDWDNRKLQIPYSGSPYLKLYGVDQEGNTRLMTQDHIIPKWDNGSNELENLCCMCNVCNETKDSSLPTPQFLALHGGKRAKETPQSRKRRKNFIEKEARRKSFNNIQNDMNVIVNSNN